MKKKCLFCKKEFSEDDISSKWYFTKAKYCSVACSNRGKSKKGKEHPLWKEKKCIDCGKDTCRAYCKRCIECSKKFRIKENHPQWKGGDSRLPKCKDCGKKVTNMNNTYCRSCYNEIMRNRIGEKHPCWVGEEVRLENKRHNQMEYKRKKRGADGHFTVKEWKQLKQNCGNMCLCCKKTEPEIRLEADHIIPISRGGSNYIANIQPLCRSCNARKSAKTIIYNK
jgi:5-methylcytosine-specific restriction endonuclease McrA